MALIPCPECRNQVSTTATACPKCGFALTPAIVAKAEEQQKSGKRTGLIIAAVVGLFVWIAISSGDPTTSSTSRATSAPPVPAQPQLELVATQWRRSSDMFITMEGQVRNISNEPLEDVTAVTTYTNTNGDFITSDDALIDFNPILPGQTSPFSTITTYNPEITRARVEFKHLMGGTILTKPK